MYTLIARFSVTGVPIKATVILEFVPIDWHLSGGATPEVIVDGIWDGKWSVALAARRTLLVGKSRDVSDFAEVSFLNPVYCFSNGTL